MILKRLYHDLLNQPRLVDLVDVCIIGGGPSGLATAIRFKQLDTQDKFRVIVLEKGSNFGSHTVSGAIIDPHALRELFPDEKDWPHDLLTKVTKDDFKILINKTRSMSTYIPKSLRNKDKNFICSLGKVTHWLSEKAESLGVELYPGISVADMVWGDNGKSVQGCITRDMGINKMGKPRDNYEPGLQFHARQTVLAEGCRGSLTKQIVDHFHLYKGIKSLQTYGLGIKEVWQVKPENFRKGYASHTMGYPLSVSTYGGGFQYHFDENMVTIGLVIGLDYKNPYLSPYQEFQKLKKHPYFEDVLKGGKCLSYGARALNEGGLQTIPKLNFPGGILVGDSAGFMNVPKIKGSHTAMMSGIIAANEMWEKLNQDESIQTDKEFNSDTIKEFANSEKYKLINLEQYPEQVKSSWIYDELKEVRNIRPSFNTTLGLFGGLVYSAMGMMFFKGKEPWTFQYNGTDALKTELASSFEPIKYDKPDNEITFDIMTSINRTGTYHDDQEPCHLKIGTDQDLERHSAKAFERWQGIEERYCPAGVYEYDDMGKFKIHAQNCIHCKTCDIKDPTGDTNWVVPEGNDGPNYTCN